MGIKGSIDVINIFFGSNIVIVMEKICNCFVLVIFKGIVYFLVFEIVFFISFKIYFKKRELDYLIDIVKIINVFIRIFYIGEEDNLNEE